MTLSLVQAGFSLIDLYQLTMKELEAYKYTYIKSLEEQSKEK